MSLNGTAPQDLAAHCVPVSATESRQHLHSAASHQLVVPSYRLSSYGRHVGPSLLLVRRCGTLYRNNCVILFTPPPSLVGYWRHFFFHSTSVYSALEADFSALMRYINSRFTYLELTPGQKIWSCRTPVGLFSVVWDALLLILLLKGFTFTTTCCQLVVYQLDYGLREVGHGLSLEHVLSELHKKTFTNRIIFTNCY